MKNVILAVMGTMLLGGLLSCEDKKQAPVVTTCNEKSPIQDLLNQYYDVMQDLCHLMNTQGIKTLTPDYSAVFKRYDETMYLINQYHCTLKPEEQQKIRDAFIKKNWDIESTIKGYLDDRANMAEGIEAFFRTSRLLNSRLLCSSPLLAEDYAFLKKPENKEEEIAQQLKGSKAITQLEGDEAEAVNVIEDCITRVNALEKMLRTLNPSSPAVNVDAIKEHLSNLEFMEECLYTDKSGGRSSFYTNRAISSYYDLMDQYALLVDKQFFNNAKLKTDLAPFVKHISIIAEHISTRPLDEAIKANLPAIKVINKGNNYAQ